MSSGRIGDGTITAPTVRAGAGTVGRKSAYLSFSYGLSAPTKSTVLSIRAIGSGPLDIYCFLMGVGSCLSKVL